jgi:methionyl aminopeptidase
MIILKTYRHINRTRNACALVAKYLEIVEKEARPGITTKHLDKLATEFAKDHNAIPAFKGYEGFPCSICASVNNEIIHGIPSNRPLREGDILSVDYGILLDGYYGDSAITLAIGEVEDSVAKLIKVGQECLYRGIKKFCEGARLNDISFAIQSYAEDNGYSLIKSYGGHGVGKQLHEDPQLPNFTRRPGEGIAVRKGMILAIEPMILSGSNEVIKDKNNWTVLTKDGGLSVHWEHTVALTEKGTEVLTKRQNEKV